jgi:hypothetical protein
VNRRWNSWLLVPTELLGAVCSYFIAILNFLMNLFDAPNMRFLAGARNDSVQSRREV